MSASPPVLWFSTNAIQPSAPVGDDGHRMSAESTQKSGRFRKCPQLWRKLSTVGMRESTKSQEPNYENAGKVGNVGFVAFPFPNFPRFLTFPLSCLFPSPVRLAFGCSIQNLHLDFCSGFNISSRFLTCPVSSLFASPDFPRCLILPVS